MWWVNCKQTRINTRELISAQKRSHKHDNKDLSCWSLCTLYLLACQVESYCRRLRSLLSCTCDLFQALINSLVCWFCMRALGLNLFQIYKPTQAKGEEKKHIPDKPNRHIPDKPNRQSFSSSISLCLISFSFCRFSSSSFSLASCFSVSRRSWQEESTTGNRPPLGV